MLRITRTKENDFPPTLMLEGKLLQPWTDELRLACLDPHSRQPAARLDLAHVSYVDLAGAHLLEELVEQGVELVACSHFVATLLRREIH